MGFQGLRGGIPQLSLGPEEGVEPWKGSSCRKTSLGNVFGVFSCTLKTD
jgi:hypothetical protein